MQTFSKMYAHIVWATHQRTPVQDMGLRKKIVSICQDKAHSSGCHVLAAYMMPDHLHILISYSVGLDIPQLVRLMKSRSSNAVHEVLQDSGFFGWQSGYACISVGYDKLPVVIGYINNQESHHAEGDFCSEMTKLYALLDERFDPDSITDA